MKKGHFSLIWIVMGLLTYCIIWAPISVKAQGTPYLKHQGDAVQLIVKGEPFIMLGGELHNSSSSSLEYMSTIWDKLNSLNCNTALASVSWEQFEPVEGQYNYDLIDGLIFEARRHELKLVFLWFASWKNGQSSYVPGWVQRDLKRFPRILRKDGNVTGVITPLCEEACQADAKAFAALMRHIREIDQTENTVLMIQIENEVGLLGDSRDRSPAAEEAFHSPVPQKLMQYISTHKEELIPEFRKTWETNGFKEKGTWADVFGDNADGDEIFMAWHYARYMNAVAQAGKQAYPLPMYVNAWLVQFEGQAPGKYPSGGPVSKMMDVWRAGAPAIDLFAPDIYLNTFKEVCESYTRSGNPLFIPEVARGDEAAAKAFYAIAQHNAICFAPFGIESLDANHPIVKAYSMLASILPQIRYAQGTGKMFGLYQQGDEQKKEVDLGDCRLYIDFRKTEDGDKGYGLIIALAPNDFLIAGTGFTVHPGPRPGFAKRAEILSVEEGYSVQGKWHTLRRLNGDETAANWQAQLPPNTRDEHHLETFGDVCLLRMKVVFFE